MLIDYDLAATRVNVKDPNKIKSLCDFISDIFEEETGFIWSERTDLVVEEKTRSLVVNTIPCKLKNATLSLTEGAGLDRVFYELSSVELVNNRLISFSGNFPNFVRYTVSGGYTWDTLPGRIKEAMLLQLEYQLIRNQEDKISLQYQNFQNGGGKYGGMYHPIFEKAISSNKLISIS